MFCFTMESLCYYLLTLFFILFIKIFSNKKKNLPPSPLALPLLGHLHLYRKPLHRTLHKLSTQYGPLIFLRFGSRSLLVISSQSLIEECFTKNDIIFANRPFSIAGDHLSYNYTIFGWSPYGQHWRNMRRITTIEIFSSKSLQLSSTVRREEIHGLVKYLLQSSNGGSQPFDMKFLFSKLMFNIMMRMVAGKRLFEDEFLDLNEQKRVHVKLKETFGPTVMLDNGDFLPILRWFGIDKAEKTFIKLQKERDSFLQNLIDEYRRKKESSSITRTANEERKKTTILEALMSIQEAEPEHYSDEFLKGAIMTMFTAGTETTTLTMEWAMSLLLNHPHELQKVQIEIDHHAQGRLIDDSDLSQLPYLHCVINETLRLYPPAPLLVPHASSQECTIGGYHVPQGTVLFANIWAIHRDPKVWVEPSMFMPERFKSIKGEKEREMGFKFIPFGVGRRGCPGAGLAMRVVALALGTVIQCFEWERVGEEQVEMNEINTGVTMPKAKPLVAACKPRRGVLDAVSQI